MFRKLGLAATFDRRASIRSVSAVGESGWIFRCHGCGPCVRVSGLRLWVCEPICVRGSICLRESL